MFVAIRYESVTCDHKHRKLGYKMVAKQPPPNFYHKQARKVIEAVVIYGQ